MNALTLTQTRTSGVPFGAIALYRLVERTGETIARFQRWNEMRRTAAQLRRLSPRLLDDIGLTPGDVDDYGRF